MRTWWATSGRWERPSSFAKTAGWVLLGLLSCRPVDGQSLQNLNPNAAPPAQEKPAEDPLGRSTPYGTVVGFIAAAENESLERAAEYLNTAPRPSERRELARQLGVVLDRRLRASLARLSEEPAGDLSDGLTSRDPIGVVPSPSGDVEIIL